LDRKRQYLQINRNNLREKHLVKHEGSNVVSDIVESWLSEYSKESVKNQYRRQLQKFLAWSNTTVETILTEWKTTTDKDGFRKKYGSMIVKYYNYLLTEKQCKINTARSETNGIRAFFTSQCDKVKIGRGKIGKSQIAFGEHEFKLEQLQRMYRVGNIRDKAILSLAVSLGYGATAFIELKRDFIESIIKQTEYEEPPIGFWYQRKKTSQPIRSHLTVESIQALTDYWETLPKKSEWVFPNSSMKHHISDDDLNYVIKTLCSKANIVVMGKVRFHLMRKFLFSALTNVMDELNAKLCVGKSIPNDVLTYLKGKTEILKQQYAEAEKYFVLSGYTNHNHSIIGELQTKVKLQDDTLQKFLEVFTAYLTEKISKKQAIAKTKTITETHGRIISDKEIKEIREYEKRIDKKSETDTTKTINKKLK